MSSPIKYAYAILFYCILTSTSNSIQAQQDLSKFTLYAGGSGPGSGISLIGSSITVNGGIVGANKLVQTTGNTTINADIYSGDRVVLTNSNIVTGKISARNSSGSTTAISIGSSAMLGDNISDSILAKAGISIGGGTVAGIVRLPAGNSYSGPTPASGPSAVVYSDPYIPPPPAMLPITSIVGGAGTITNPLASYAPGTYGTFNFSGNKTLTLKAPLNGSGNYIYYFKAFTWTGNSNKLVFDFNGGTGKFLIYIEGNADFGKLSASYINGGGADKIYIETYGDGVGTSIPGNSFIIANGSSGGGSKWVGTVYASRAGISIGSGTGSSSLTGALYSVSNVTLQSGVTVNYSGFNFCTPIVANAGPDQTGATTCGLTTVTLAANNPSPGTGQWSVVSGPAGYSFSNISSPTSTFTGVAGGAYTLRWTITNSPCPLSTDDVNIVFNGNPTTANAGPDQTNSTTCGLTTVTLAANTPTVGTGSWNVVSGSGGSFGNASSPTSTFSGTAGTTYTLRWTISNSPCTASTDDVVVTFNTIPTNVDAGVDKALQVTGQVKLTGTTSQSNPSYNWTTNDGVILTSPATQAQIIVTSAGTYTFTVTNSAGCSASDNVKVTGRLRKIIGSELQSIYDNYGPNSPNPDTAFFNIIDGYVSIDIICQVDTNIVLNLLRQPQYGLINIIPNGLSKHTVTGDYPILNLPGLDSLQNILNFCRPYYRPFTNAGITLTQGDTTMRSYLVRKGYNLDGAGFKIGVLSDSYNTIPNGTTATLPLQPITDPPNPIPQTFNTNTATQDTANGDVNKGVYVLQDYPGRKSDEGRAMINIIGDVAPGATPVFRTGFFTPGDCAQGIRELKEEGCKIMVDDITFITEPMLKDGIVAKTVNEMRDSGVVYFSAAGNFANRSYESPFIPIDASSKGFAGKTAHNFGAGFGPDTMFQRVRLAPGNYVFVLQWVDDIYTADEVGGTHFDVDFYLSRQTNGTGLIGFNRDNAFGDPIEFIPIYIPPAPAPQDPATGDSTDYYILIVNNTPGGGPDRIKYVAYKGGIRIMEYNIGTSTIVGQANADGAITIGAARFNHVPGHPLLPASLTGITKPQIEGFSSLGGTYVTDALGVQTQRLKPDLVGPDGGNTTVKMGQDYPNNALDGFSNFFGTSAAAPHAAAAAALVMQGRKKFLAGHPETTPNEIKSLLQSTAVDMRPNGLVGYDFHSGAGLVDADAAMRTFAAPIPFEIKLVKPTNIIPCQDPFVLTIVGENFSNNSIVYMVENPGQPDSVVTTLTPSYITDDTIRVTINACVGNPEVYVFTPPRTAFGDGGPSNRIRLFTKIIAIHTVDTTKKYGQVNPFPRTIITVDDTLIEQSHLTRTDVGLDATKLNLMYSNATNNSPVGTYKITAYRTFSNQVAEDLDLTSKYRYIFDTGRLFVQKLPLKVTPNDITVTSGDAITNLTFNYEFDPLYPPANLAALRDTAKKYHQVFLAANALAVVKDFKTPQAGGYILSDADLANMNMMTSFKALKNSRKFKIVNGKLVPRDTTIFLDSYYLLDIASTNIYDYAKVDKAKTNFYTGYAGYTKKGLLSESALDNGHAQAPTTNGNLATLLNGNLAPMMNGNLATLLNASLAPMINGNLVSYLNGNLATLLNGVATPIPNSPLVYLLNGNLVYLLNGTLAPILNGGLVTLLNGQTITITDANSYVTIPNSTGVLKLTNGGLAQYLNGNLAPLINSANVVSQLNGSLATLINGVATPIPNSPLVYLLNGNLVYLLNGTLAPIINGGLVTLLNGQTITVTDANSYVTIPNSAAVMKITNGGLAQYLNGNLAPLINATPDLLAALNGNLATLLNGNLAPLINGNLVSFLNGGLASYLNGNLAPILNGNLATLLNTSQMTFANGGLVTLLNSDASNADSSDNNTAVIIDETDVDPLNNYSLGAMFAINMITGLGEGTQTVVPGVLVNPNFDVSYGLGHVVIKPDSACLLTHGTAKNITNTAQVPTTMWLSMTTKVSGQLTAVGDSLFFRSGSITFNFVNSTPTVLNMPVPNGMILAIDAPIQTPPSTSWNVSRNMWITTVPKNFASTSDIFVTGALIPSSNGFTKSGGNTNSVMKGMFFSNKAFSDQWGYGLAPYQGVNYNYNPTLKNPGDVIAINGNYKAGTPVPLIPYYAGTGNAYTGSFSSFDNFTACLAPVALQNKQVSTSELLITQDKNILEPSVVIYPNPASASITLAIVPEQTGNARIEMFTINGAKVMETNDGVYEAGMLHLKKINVSKLVNGIYLVRIWNGNAVTNKKIIITR